MPAPKRRRLAVILLALAAVLTVSLSGLLSPRPAARYTVTDLGVLPGDTESSASAINSRGVAVGYSRGTFNRACVFQDGKVTSLGVPPGAKSSEALDVNSSGDVAGYAEMPAGHHAFLYSAGKGHDLGTLPRFSGSEVIAINDTGEAVGNITNFTGRAGLTLRRGLLYDHGRMIALGTLPGFLESDARSINTSGQIAGTCYSSSGPVRWAPFLYDNRTTTMLTLPMPVGCRRGWANGVNDSGQVIGDVLMPGGNSHAVLWHGNRMADLGTPSGYSVSIGSGLNNRGEAVGYCFDEGSVKSFLRDHTSAHNPLRGYLDRDMEHAFVYQGSKMQDLNEMIPRDSDWTLENAQAINDRGQIVGQGLHGGRERAFLLTPVR